MKAKIANLNIGIAIFPGVALILMLLLIVYLCQFLINARDYSQFSTAESAMTEDDMLDMFNSSISLLLDCNEQMSQINVKQADVLLSYFDNHNKDNTKELFDELEKTYSKAKENYDNLLEKTTVLKNWLESSSKFDSSMLNEIESTKIEVEESHSELLENYYILME